MIFSSRILFTIFLIFFINPFLFSDEILLKDGTKVQGEILNITSRGVNVRTPYVDIVIGHDRIEKILRNGRESISSRDATLQPKTDFEKAEQLYHEGKILESVPIYQKIIERDPANEEVILRLNEIEKRLIFKMKTDNLISVNPIRPISEQDIIFQATRLPTQTETQTREAPLTPAPNLGATTRADSQASLPPFSQLHSPTQPSQHRETVDSISTGQAFGAGLPPLLSAQSLPPIPPGQPSETKAPHIQDISSGSPFHVPKDAQSAPFQDPAVSREPPAGDRSMPSLAPFGQIPTQSQPPMAPPYSPPSTPGDSISRSSYDINQPQPPLSTATRAQPEQSSAISRRAPFLQDQSAPMISSSPTGSSPFLQQAPFLQSDQQTRIQPSTPPSEVKKEPSVPSFFIAGAASQSPPTASSPDQSVAQTAHSQVSRSVSSTSVPDSEFRGVWISRFEWPDKNPEISKQKILRYLDEIAAHNFNAVVFQIRGQGDALYPSPFEPWSHLLGGGDPGFDPLEFALTEARARNLEFHAYLNVYPVWQGETPPPRSNPEHPFWLYCQPDSSPNLLCVKKNGAYMKPDKNENDNYYYFTPGNPHVSAYIRKITMDVINRYDIDGIHFDRIRYPGIDYSYDKVSLERFKGEGNPGGLSWLEWQCDQITRFLNDVSGEIASVKPRVKVSVAGWGIYDKNRYPGYSGFSSGYHQYYQDTFGWMKRGVIDALMPMIYWDIKNPKPNYDELAKDFIENSSGRHVYCANWANQNKMPDDEFTAQVNLIRQFGGQGNIVFSVGGLERRDLFPLFKNELYPKPATIPDMPWKSNPQTGILTGKVIRKDTGEPVTDAWINITGRAETWLSSADGFFAILHISPGASYQITITKTGVGDYASQPFAVEAGRITRIDIALGG